MTKYDMNRFLRAVDHGYDILRARAGGISWNMIGDETGMHADTAKDTMCVYWHCFLDDRSTADLPSRDEFEYDTSPDSVQTLLSAPGTVSWSREDGFYVCLSTRDYYYERTGADSLALALKWYAWMIHKNRDGADLSQIPHTRYNDA